MYIFGIIIVSLVVQAKFEIVPSTFPICSTADSVPFWECVSKAVPKAITSMTQGLKSFDIPPLDPLEVNDLSTNDQTNGFSLNLDYTNCKIYGLTKGLQVQYKPVDNDGKILKFDSFNDQVDFIADYTMSGRLIFLPFEGKGRVNITMVGLNSENNLYYDNVTRDGEEYMVISKYELKLKPTKVSFNFDNLFREIPILSHQLNEYFHSNSKIVFQQYQPTFEEKLGLLFQKFANNIFNRIPVKKIFPD